MLSTASAPTGVHDDYTDIVGTSHGNSTVDTACVADQRCGSPE